MSSTYYSQVYDFGLDDQSSDEGEGQKLTQFHAQVLETEEVQASALKALVNEERSQERVYQTSLVTHDVNLAVLMKTQALPAGTSLAVRSSPLLRILKAPAEHVRGKGQQYKGMSSSTVSFRVGDAALGPQGEGCLDSGASVSLADAAFLEKVGARLTHQDESICLLAVGPDAKTLGRTDLRVFMESTEPGVWVEFDMTFYAVAKLGVDVIIGNDWQQPYQMNLIREGRPHGAHLELRSFDRPVKIPLREITLAFQKALSTFRVTLPYVSEVRDESD